MESFPADEQQFANKTCSLSTVPEIYIMKYYCISKRNIDSWIALADGL